MNEDKEKEPCWNTAQENWDSKTRYEYLKKMSAIAISALEKNKFVLGDEEVNTFLKLFAIELKFRWHINK